MSFMSFEDQMRAHLKKMEVARIVENGIFKSGVDRVDSSARVIARLYTDTIDAKRKIFESKFIQTEKARLYAELYAETAARAERAYTVLWGAIEIGQWSEGSRRLSDSAEAWQELAKAEIALAEARSNAEKVDPAAYQGAIKRAEALIANADLTEGMDFDRTERQLSELEAKYQTASAIVRAAAQDVWPPILAEKFGQKSRGLRLRLEKDRAARVNTPDVIKAETRLYGLHQALADTLAICLDLLREITPNFRPESEYLRRFSELVGLQTKLIPPPDEKKNSGPILLYEVVRRYSGMPVQM